MDGAPASQSATDRAAAQASGDESGYVSQSQAAEPERVQNGASGDQPRTVVAESAQQGGRLRAAPVRQQAPLQSRGGGRALTRQDQHAQRTVLRSRRSPSQSRSEQRDWARSESPTEDREPRRRERPRSASRGREGPPAEWGGETYDEEIGAIIGHARRDPCRLAPGVPGRMGNRWNP